MFCTSIVLCTVKIMQSSHIGNKSFAIARASRIQFQPCGVNGLWKCRHLVSIHRLVSYFQMRKKQKDTDASGDEKKDDEDASEQKKASSPSHVDSSPQYFDSAAGPAGYCSHHLLILVCNQPATQGQLSLPSRRDRSMSTSFGWEGKGRYGSVSGCTRGVQVKL